MGNIHPTAIVDSRAELADGVTVGPYAIIEGHVQIGAGTAIQAHSIVRGHTIIGAGCKIGPAAYVGLDPQHLGYEGTETWLVIGDRTIIREGASVHRATKPGVENATRVGSDCFLMGACHVAHDCQLADRVTMANGSLLGGHVHIAERTFVGGGAGVHQFVHVGRLVMIRGNDALPKDVPPFAAVAYGGLKGYNAIGCRRAGLSREAIQSIRKAYHCIHTHRSVNAAVEAIRQTVPLTPEVREMLDFIASAKRGLPPSGQFMRRLIALTREGDGAE